MTIFQERLSTLSIRCIKNEKFSQTNCGELLDDFDMKKFRTKPFQLLTSALLDSRPVTMGAQGCEFPLENYSPLLEKCVGRSLKLLDIV